MEWWQVQGERLRSTLHSAGTEPASSRTLHSFQLPWHLFQAGSPCRLWDVAVFVKSRGFYLHVLQSDKLSTSLGGVSVVCLLLLLWLL